MTRGVPVASRVSVVQVHARMPLVDDGIREAASAVVARDGEDGLEVVVVERSAASRFLPGYVAFPGGSTEQEDRELARRWFGTPEEARRACAVRELAEEVSFALTLTGLAQGNELDAIDAAPPSSGQLPELAHWVAPPRVPVRFDARYFAVRAPAGIEPVPDGGETADAWWVSPARLLEEGTAGLRRLYWPTFFTVTEILGCRSVDELFGLRIRTREPHDDELERLPRSTFWQD
jgi:8-oxo-dGTP pyrophosphatase MutT (NUDIX family)